MDDVPKVIRSAISVYPGMGDPPEWLDEMDSSGEFRWELQ